MFRWIFGAVLAVACFLLAGDRFYHLKTKGEDHSYSDLYMRRVAKQEGVVELIPEYLYVRRVKVGAGPRLGGEDLAAFHIKCKSLRGECLVDTYRNKRPIAQDMNFAIGSFRQGVIGMQEGERRILYIHPDYGKSQFRLKEPATPLVVEAELLEIHQNGHY